MRFLFENREKIDKLDSHDGMFEGYSFDSEKRTISMSWMHGFEKNKRVHCLPLSLNFIFTYIKLETSYANPHTILTGINTFIISSLITAV